MLQNAFHIALYDKCDINVKAGVLFEEEIIQEIVSQLQWIFISCIHCYKNNCSFSQNIS